MHHKDYRALVTVAAIALLLAAGEPRALAQTIAEVAAYQGPDRTERLIAGAKKEGTLSFYSSSVAEDTAPVIEAFKKKYGLDVQVWRGSTETIIQRAVAESRAGRCPADAYHAGSPALEPLHRENLLQAVKSPAAEAVMQEAKRPHGEYVGISVNLFSAAYNTDLVKPDELPKSYEDLTDPRWKGRLAIEADDVPWFAAIVSAMGEDKGVKLFGDIVRTNGHLGAQGTYAVGQHGRRRRGAVRAHRVQLQVGPVAARRRAGAHVLPAAGDRARHRHLGVALRAAPQRCRAVL